MLVVTVGGVLALAASAAHASFPGRNGLIVFARYGGRAPGIYVIRVDGTHVRRLVAGARHPFASLGPRWSPNGSHIVYFAQRTESDAPRIVVVGATGMSRRVVLRGQPGETDLSDPAWTPQGLVSWQTFAGGIQTCVQVEGEAQPRFCDAGERANGRWSAEGSYAWRKNGGSELALVNQGGGETRMAALDGAYPQFDWSPDGGRFIFVAPYKINNPLPLLAVVRTDAKGWHLLDRGRRPGAEPAWSPNGKQIVFYDGKGLVIADATGRHLVQLTHNSSDAQPDWQPR